MIYDIRNEDLALRTLERLTGVKCDIWEEEVDRNIHRIDFSTIDEEILKTIRKHKGILPKLQDIEAVAIHLTTSNNGCLSIREHGLIDLKEVYNNPESELRQFLTSNGISIFLNDGILQFNGNDYDINCNARHVYSGSPEYKAWCVGNKLYNDYAVCGFFSINPEDVYAGNVHRRPEILFDLDGLLGTDLENLWIQNHQSYEIVFLVPLEDTIYSGYAEKYEDVVLSYIYYAFMTVLQGPDTKHVVCKDGVNISPESIKDISRFCMWK